MPFDAARKTSVSFQLVLALGILLAPAARAAPLEAVPLEAAPVQLSLPFAAAHAVAVFAAPSLLPAPAAAAPPVAALPTFVFSSLSGSIASRAAAPLWGSMPPSVDAAFRSGDARAFWTACRSAEYDPPESDDAQQFLLREGGELTEADRLAQALSAPAEPRAAPVPVRATKIDYEAFGRALARRPGLSVDVFRDAGAKRAILRSAGYSRLHASGGARVSIDAASDARVGRAFAATLRAYRNRPR